MCEPMARSSAIHRIVPSARSPQSLSMSGPNAASRIGVGATSVMSSGLWTPEELVFDVDRARTAQGLIRHH